METKHRHLTDEEFLRLCSDKRHQSPIIEELCQRLEEYLGCDKPSDREIELRCKNEFTCQVCEAKFKVEFNPDDDDQIQVSFLS